MALEIALNLLLARVKISKLPQRLWTPPSIMYDKLTTKTANIYQDFVDIRAQAQISVAAFFHTSWPLGVCFTAHRGCSGREALACASSWCYNRCIVKLIGPGEKACF